MDLFINYYQKNIQKSETSKDLLPFKANPDKKVVKEISDDIFKIASTAITAAGIAALGIKSKNESEVKEPKKELVTKSELARRLDIDSHSVEWHLNEHLVMEENKLIDLEHPINKRFMETYKKGTRFVETLYTPDRYQKLEKVLGKKLPLDYCLRYDLLVIDDDGVIDALKEPNKTFIDKIRSGELTYKNFFMSVDNYAAYLEIHRISVTRALQDGLIIFNEDKRIDINDPKNKAFEETVRKAQKRARDKGLKRVTSFYNVPEESETLLSRAEFAAKLGYTKPASLYLHIKNGRIILEKDGCIDITREPNKSFMEAKLSGKMIKRTDWYSRMHEAAEINPNYLSRNKLASNLGMSLATLREHIRKGHVVINEQNMIDITDEKNKYFIENYKKGVALYPTKQVVKPKNEPVERPIEIKNPNYVALKDIAAITGLTNWPLVQHAKRGRFIREEKGVDLTKPLNKLFLNKYEENGIEKLRQMSLHELEELKEGMESRYKNLIPKSIYIQAKEALNKSEEEYRLFIEDITYSLFRVEILSEKELNFIENMVDKIIRTRLDNAQKPTDFSDIKDFKLSGIIELEYSLNIIDTLLEAELSQESTDKPTSSFFNSKKMFQKPFTNSAKLKMSQVIKDNMLLTNWKAIFAKWQTQKLEDVDKLSVGELKSKLIEMLDVKKISGNRELSGIIEFLYEYDYAEEADIDVLKSFVKELIKYEHDNTEKFEFSKEVLKKAKKLESDLKNNEIKKKEHFDSVVKRLEGCKKYLYDVGMTEAADICYKYIPQSVDDVINLKNANYIISLVDLLKQDIVLDKNFIKTHTAEEQAAEKIRLEKLRNREVFFTILGYDAEKSKPEMLKEAKEFALSRYGEVNIINTGEYAYLFNQMNSCEFSSYPKFSHDFLYKHIGDDNIKFAIILSKLNEWSELPEEEQSKFLSVYTRFSKKVDSDERDLLNDYLIKYYKYHDTVIIATGWKDKKIKIPAVMTQRVKEKEMFKKIKQSELIEYIEEFESCMDRIVGKTDTFGIKDYEGNKKKDKRTHEVKISYPARLYCNKGKEDIFIFDDFEYNAHQGSKT